MKAFVVPLLREFLYLLGVWRPKIDSSLEHAVDDFVRCNASHWPPLGSTGSRILVEGHLSDYGPNYLFRTALVARVVQESAGGGVVDVVANGHSYHWSIARRAYASFGIANWIFLGRRFLLLAPFLWSYAALVGLWEFRKLASPEAILGLHFGGIRVGDLVYDEVMRCEKAPTIRAVNRGVYRVLQRSLYYYFQYRLLLRRGTYQYYVATHTAYPEYGLLCRVALQNGVTVIETSDIQMSVYRSIGETDLPTYHQGINAAIRAELGVGRPMEHAVESARRRLRQRLNSEVDQIDAKKAYAGTIYDRRLLADTLGYVKTRRVGFILAHIFVDSPHLSSSMLYPDYYRWLEGTIARCALTEEMEWIVKPHPSCGLYGEQGMVESMVRSSGAANIHLCPADFNTGSLVQCADLILTVHGTAGLEYSCMGVPAILAGTPFYAGFGFAYEPRSVEEYEALLSSANDLPRLRDDQVERALQVFHIWENQFDWNNPIITTEVLSAVWGSGVPRDPVRAYALLTENLARTDPRTLKLWHFVHSALEQ